VALSHCCKVSTLRGYALHWFVCTISGQRLGDWSQVVGLTCRGPINSQAATWLFEVSCLASWCMCRNSSLVYGVSTSVVHYA
jgi:hypothetical protein